MDTQRKTDRFSLSPHRRVGLFSFVCVGAGVAWLALSVLPGLSRSEKRDGINRAEIGIFGLRSWAASETVASPSPPPASFDTLQERGDFIETAFVNAPAGTALQTVLVAGRYSASQSPTVTGTITYRNVGSARPFWETFGHVLGAAPAPGLQIVQSFDGYVILPRNVTPPESREQFRGEDGRPREYVRVPVPMTEKPTHRMAGYVGVALVPGKDKFVSPAGMSAGQCYALLESRIPGQPPLWRLVRQGEALGRKTAQAIARESNVAANIDTAPVVETITPDAVVLRGGGDKTLRVPLGVTGVADTFATPTNPAILPVQNSDVAPLQQERY